MMVEIVNNLVKHNIFWTSITTLNVAATGFKNVLVIGADSLSRYVDWTDRGTCILFGDAAGVVLLQVKIKSTDMLS